MDGIDLHFDEAVLDLIVQKAMENKLGARGLRGICEAIMLDLMYDIPSEKNPPKEFKVALEYAQKKLANESFANLKAA